MKRREFMKKAGQTVALTALASQTEFLLGGCDARSDKQASLTKPDFDVPRDLHLPKIAPVF